MSEATDFNSALDRSWDELDLLDQRIANLEAELKAAKGANERELLQKELTEAKAKREEEAEYLKRFYQ